MPSTTEPSPLAQKPGTKRTCLLDLEPATTTTSAISLVPRLLASASCNTLLSGATLVPDL